MVQNLENKMTRLPVQQPVFLQTDVITPGNYNLLIIADTEQALQRKTGMQAYIM